MTRTGSAVLLCALAGYLSAQAVAQGPGSPGAADRPTNDPPNPYKTVDNYFKLPEGRSWGSTSAVAIDKDGKSIWVGERCGANTCVESPTVDPILHFDATGKLLKSFGAGLIMSPHGIFVDRDGNIWMTDWQDNAPRPQRGAGGRGAAGSPPAGAGAAGSPPSAGAPGDAAAGRAAAPPAGPIGPPAGATKGYQVFKFNPEGKLLLTLGKAGGAADPAYFYQPNAVLVAPNGDIFVSQGHGQPVDRIFKFSKDGTLIKSWGKRGTGPNEFDQPHALAMDSKGRLFVGDRNNNRIQILDQNGTYITEWKQFSRPSGIYIDKSDTIYVADSESESVSRNHDGWKRGIRIGSAKDGVVKSFIPDPETRARADGFSGTSAAEGVAADPQGSVYGAEVGPKAVKKYVKNQ